MPPPAAAAFAAASAEAFPTETRSELVVWALYSIITDTFPGNITAFKRSEITWWLATGFPEKVRKPLCRQRAQKSWTLQTLNESLCRCLLFCPQRVCVPWWVLLALQLLLTNEIVLGEEKQDLEWNIVGLWRWAFPTMWCYISTNAAQTNAKTLQQKNTIEDR